MEQTGVILKDRKAISKVERIFRSFKLRAKMRSHLRNRQESGYPTEAEWEFVARVGLSGKPFVWGDQFRPNGKWMANTYQGYFPGKDTGNDGHVGTSHVGLYQPNGYGLYDMAGNVGSG